MYIWEWVSLKREYHKATMRRNITESLQVRIHGGQALNTLNGIPRIDISCRVNTIQFGYCRLKRLVPSTFITNFGQDKYFVDDLNMAWVTVSMRAALR